MEKKEALWLQVSWGLLNMKNSWADWLHLKHSCLGAFLQAPSWRGDTEKQRENQVGVLIFINQVVNLLHVMKAKHQHC